MALSSLGAVLLAGHPSFLSQVVAKVDLRSFFLAVVFVIIVLVLAYLTNPSETSFRTYLTELSFKQHLSRLDESGQDDSSASDDSGVHFTRTRKQGSDFNPSSPFHFVSRASVSLRTPKHVFYSLGVLTIAAVYPTGRSTTAIQSESLGSLVSDAWYVGAFGRWWRGGVIQSWWHEMLANTKDTERCGSGILDVKALDVLEGLDGLPFPTSLRLPSDNSTKKSTHRSPNNIPRSTTPPPLPKSASLPLHAPRVPNTPPKLSGSQSQRHAPSPAQTAAPITPEPSRPPAAPVLAYSPSAPSLWDSSPVIAEVLRQISQSKAAVHDLRTQLADFRVVADDSRASIQSELDGHRERKREEDGARAELKSRTKNLEDSKRSAESSKRDAEKRLRAAESARDSAAARIERLEGEIGVLRGRMQEDEEAVVACKAEGDAEEQKMEETMERKRKEIKVAEDVVAALNMRAKELEERIAEEEERLRRAKEEAEIKKQDRSFYPLTVVPTVDESDIAIPLWQEPSDARSEIDHLEPFPHPIRAPRSKGSSSGSGSSDGRDVSVSPRPARLSLTSISNLREPNRALPEPDPNGQVLLRPHPYSLFNGDIPSTISSQSTSTRFSPFGDSDDVAEPISADALNSSNSLSPVSSSYIPSSLIKTLDGGGSFENIGLVRSFQSEDDTVLSRDWRKNALFSTPHPVESPGTGIGVYTTSPSSLTCPPFEGVDRDDPFEIRVPSLRRRLTSDVMDMQRAVLPPSRAISDPPLPPIGLMPEPDAQEKAALAHRRWSSQQEARKEKKGLNPEAKAFSLTKKSIPSLFSASASAAQTQPQHVSLPAPAHTSTTGALSLPAGLAEQGSLMRAFAPSPAEREALQRALGGSSNTSLERLPTLSEVSAAVSGPSLPLPLPLPPSPPHSQAVARPGLFGFVGAHANGNGNGTLKVPGDDASAFGHGGSRTLLGPSFAWLQGLPKVRKTKFSPWEDEETKEVEEA